MCIKWNDVRLDIPLFRLVPFVLQLTVDDVKIGLGNIMILTQCMVFWTLCADCLCKRLPFLIVSISFQHDEMSHVWVHLSLAK